MKQNVLYLLLSVLTVLLFSGGCASTEDVGKIQWNFNSLRSEVIDLKRRYQSLEKQVPGKEGQLNRRLQDLEEEQRATGKALSDLIVKLQTITSEFQLLTGRFEESRYFSEKSTKELTENSDSLTAQIKQIEITVNSLREKLDSMSAQVEKQTISKQTAKKAGAGKEKKAKDLYMEAYKAYKENRPGEARKNFQALLREYPKSEYSDNARFWIGESYYTEKNYEEAILAYEELFKKNPGSNKKPGAMLKQGLAFYELKDKETGKLILEQLIEKFPDSEQAKTAKKKLGQALSSKKKRAVPPKKNQ